MLHSHLPFVRHPEYPEFLEEDWLFEAITETYIPFITIFERLLNDRVPFRITLSITPTLAAMLSDPLLQRRYFEHIERLIELAEKEVHRTRNPAGVSLDRPDVSRSVSGSAHRLQRSIPAESSHRLSRLPGRRLGRIDDFGGDAWIPAAHGDKPECRSGAG
ncbi:MAG: hypothetical protein MPW15_09610 [Candidatus Manganitrophus sp.]|nr:hypothetical protein [Candidatus Manganitrophus sp.]